MGSYDSPGFQDTTPAGPVNEHTGAPGSQPTGFIDASAYTDVAGTHGSSAFVSPGFDSIALGSRVTVSPVDVLVPSQADLYAGGDANPLSAVPGDLAGQSGAGAGRVRGGGNPNAEPAGSLADQIASAQHAG
jgi:hypothetical protein